MLTPSPLRELGLSIPTVNLLVSQLKEEGVIRYPFLFKLMTSFKHIDQFDAGTYELNSSMDYGQLMDLFFFVAIV